MSDISAQPDAGCICHGNWRNIVAYAEPFLDKHFQDQNGTEYLFYGLVHGLDDYYYGMRPIFDGQKPVWLSCVGDFSSHGFDLIESLPETEDQLQLDY